jgi:adenosylcobinamide-GDP ribazoletransferase
MREQIGLFFTALMFLTRIPCPVPTEHSPDKLARSAMYFPLVGLLVGAIGGIVYRLVAFGYAPAIAVICGIAATVIVTGAFHEDAVADVCDGFGRMDPAQRLEIMRDSRVGSFGVSGLILLIGLKAALLTSLPISRAPLAFIAAHACARWSSLVLVAKSASATDSGSLAAPFAGSVTPARLAFATVIAALAGLLLGPVTALAMLAATVLLCRAAGRFFAGWLGGISGDCLGAVNQVTEVLCYAIVVKSAILEAGLRHLLAK